MSESESSGMIQGTTAFREAVLRLARSARREIRLLSFDLDRDLYGDEAVVEVVKVFLLSAARARLRVLLNDSRAPARAGHRLVGLGRRLSSRVEFRELPEHERPRHREELMIVDDAGVLERSSPEALEARFETHSFGLAQARGEVFERLWDHSEPSSELRVLGI